MERVGSDVLISIYEKLQEQRDRKSFFQVSKNFLKASCIIIRRFSIQCSRFLNVILPGSPNLTYLCCDKPLSNEHMKLLAQSSPKLKVLYLPCSGLEENLDHPEHYELDFDDDGFCAVVNACRHLKDVMLSGRSRLRDSGVVSLVRSSKNLKYLYLARCVKITDESLKAIGEATCLEYLRLQGRTITDLGLEYLANGDLKNYLEYLDLEGCETITVDGLRALADLPKLSNLNLYSCHNISWEDVRSVPFTRLKYIGLNKRLKTSDQHLRFGNNYCHIDWN